MLSIVLLLFYFIIYSALFVGSLLDIMISLAKSKVLVLDFFSLQIFGRREKKGTEGQVLRAKAKEETTLSRLFSGT